jgi:reactive intermediate/imine deaminase
MPLNSRRKMLTGAAAIMAAAPAAQARNKSEKKILSSGPKPATPPMFSPGVQFGNLIFLAGIEYRQPGDIKVQTEGVFAEMKKQLDAAGSSMQKVLKVTVFLADMKDFAGMNAVFQGKFGDEPPVRSTAAVAWLPGNALVEIDAIAYV